MKYGVVHQFKCGGARSVIDADQWPAPLADECKGVYIFYS
jgi:hypothetical protein